MRFLSYLSCKALKSSIPPGLQVRQNLSSPVMLDSVQEFKNLVYGDAMLRMNWIHGIKKPNRIIGSKTSDQIFQMIDTACKTPPAFSLSGFVGVPISQLFLQLMQTQNGRTFFSNDRVNAALKKVLNDYCQMLLSPHSRLYLTTQKDLGWFSPEANPLVHNQWYKCDPNKEYYGFGCWNDWFLRQFKEGMRLVGSQTPQKVHEQNVIVNSCQNTPLLNPYQPQMNIKLEDQFWLKSNRYSLIDIFGGVKLKKEYLAKLFEGGTIYQGYLSALSYHRWHAPVDGVIQQIYHIDGAYFLDQSQYIPYDPEPPMNSQSFLSAVAVRMVVVIKADNQNIGKVGIVYIGMGEVSSCIAIKKIGDTVKKGEQIGHFMFGGSSHLLVFEKKAAQKLKFKLQLYEGNPQKSALRAERQNVNSYLAHLEV